LGFFRPQKSDNFREQRFFLSDYPDIPGSAAFTLPFGGLFFPQSIPSAMRKTPGGADVGSDFFLRFYKNFYPVPLFFFSASPILTCFFFYCPFFFFAPTL